MNLDIIFLVIFYLILFTIFKIYRNKFELQWGVFALYRTKIGLNLMDRIAKKFKKLLSFFSYVSIGIGFLGMFITLILLAKGALSFLSAAPQPQVAPVLPGISIAGLPKLSFWHWIISILIAAVIHEFMHGVYSRLYNIKIKSSGFAFLGPILAAFVEPDEKVMEKRPTKQQLSVLSAGPFSNIVLGIVILLFMFVIMEPIGHAIVGVQGIEVENLNESYPIISSGLKVGDVITEIDNKKIDGSEKIKQILENNKPGDSVKIKTERNEYNIILGENPNNKTEAFLGITISKFKLGPKESLGSFSWLSNVYLWLYLLVFWLFNINLGIGMFNLLPLGPVDGGRMFFAAAFHFTKNKEKAVKILKAATLLVLFLIIVNMWPFILKLLKFIFSPLNLIFG